MVASFGVAISSVVDVLHVSKRQSTGKCAIVAYALWESAKARAKKLGVPFSLTLSHIIIPERCPVLGIPLQSTPRACSDQSPTLDRIDALRGYVAGNVMVISHRANSIKRSATIEELQLVIKYMQTYGVRTTHKSRREAASGIPQALAVWRFNRRVHEDPSHSSNEATNISMHSTHLTVSFANTHHTTCSSVRRGGPTFGSWHMPMLPRPF
jgi:hypothetical protein